MFTKLQQKCIPVGCVYRPLVDRREGESFTEPPFYGSMKQQPLLRMAPHLLSMCASIKRVHVFGYFFQSDDAMNPERLYDLIAVVIHCGSGPNRGHYISIVKSHGFWLLFDDDIVDVSKITLPCELLRRLIMIKQF